MVNSIVSDRQTLHEEKEAPLSDAAGSDDLANNTSSNTITRSPLSIIVPPPSLEREQSEAENKDQISPRQPDTHPNDDKLTDQDRLNFFGRWIEIARFLGGLPAALAVAWWPTSDNDLDNQFDNQLDGTLDKIGGVVIAAGMHVAFKDKYKKVKSLNPLYRTFKTLATAGTEFGLMVADLLMLSQVFQFLAMAVFALGIGLMAIPYWLYREYVMDREKYPLHLRNQHYKTGIEGWSKYAKTFLVFGMYLGEVFGTLMTFAMRGQLVLRDIALFGAIGSVVTFVVGIICVPVINMLFGDALLTEKDNFRNNYVRSGITLGIALGSTLGFFLIPGLLPAVGMAVGAAIGSVIGGVALGVYGGSITRYIQRNWHVKVDTDNSWDYATRNSSYFFGFVGAAIGFFVPVPGGALMGAALGNAIASVPGWLAGLYMIRLARLTSPEEQKATTLPWTQRIAYGTMFGSMIGATLGFSFGWIGGPHGSVLGATLGFSAGAIIGGLAYGLYDSKARELIKMFFKGETNQTVLVEEEQEPLCTLSLSNETDVTPSPSNSSANIISILSGTPEVTNIVLQNGHRSPRLTRKSSGGEVVPIDEIVLKSAIPTNTKTNKTNIQFFPVVVNGDLTTHSRADDDEDYGIDGLFKVHVPIELKA